MKPSFQEELEGQMIDKLEWLAELHDKLDEVIDLINKHDELLQVDNEIDNKKHVIGDDATREARIDELDKIKIEWMNHLPEFKFDSSPETFKRLWNSNIDERIAQLQEQSGEPNE